MELAVRALKLDSEDTPYRSTLATPVHDNLLAAVLSETASFMRTLKQNLSRLFSRQEAAKPVRPDKMVTLVTMLQGMIEIEPVEETRLLKINVTGPDPVMARDVADAVAKAYIDFNIGNRLQSSQDTMQWLTDHLYGMKKNLEDAESEFLAFKQNANIISVEDRQKGIAQKITEFNDAYIQARNRRLELEAKLGQLNQIAASGKDIIHLRSLIPSPIVNELYSKIVALEGELASLTKVYKAMHPKVTQINSQLQEARSTLSKEIRKEIDGLRAEQAILQSREKVLQQTVADFEKEGVEANKKELKQSILKRNVEMNKNLYDTLMMRLKEADITGSVDVSNIRVTEKALLPSSPIGPNKQRNLILAVVLGLMAGVGFAFLREFLDRSLHTEEDVQRWLDLPVLAVVPFSEPAAAGKK
jgi:uncharacterized protein involved in exopolysaccharide biosynthesis